MSIEETLKRKLTEAFAPTRLEVVNESHKHHGHGGSPGTGESHFKIILASEHFKGMSKVEGHRHVYGVLGEEMAGPIHALSLEIDG